MAEFWQAPTVLHEAFEFFGLMQYAFYQGTASAGGVAPFPTPVWTHENIGGFEALVLTMNYPGEPAPTTLINHLASITDFVGAGQQIPVQQMLTWLDVDNVGYPSPTFPLGYVLNDCYTFWQFIINGLFTLLEDWSGATPDEILDARNDSWGWMQGVWWDRASTWTVNGVKKTIHTGLYGYQTAVATPSPWPTATPPPYPFIPVGSLFLDDGLSNEPVIQGGIIRTARTTPFL
jgi:hypothetical protein